MRRSEEVIMPVLRIYLGAVWFTYGESKIDPDWAAGKNYFLSAVQYSQSTTGEPFRSFLAHVVIPNSHLFGVLIAYGETLVGISLILGLATRFGCTGGMFLSLNYFFMAGKYLSHGGIESIELMLFVLCAVVLLTPSTRNWSLDAVIARRTARQNATPQHG